MRRYTTPKHVYTLPFDTAGIVAMRIVYAQNEKIIVAKEISECERAGNTVSVKLSQEETALFDYKKNFVEIQMHILDDAGNSLVSKPIKIAVEKCLDTEVLK